MDINRLSLIVIVILCQASVAGAASYGVARSLTPVLNTPALAAIFSGHDGKILKTDRCGQVRELEFIALPGTSFRIIKEIRNGKMTVFQVETADYPPPSGRGLYVDSRLIETNDTEPPPRLRKQPEADAIIAALKEAVGASYVWGGNTLQGVPELAGLDCSGLLYHATDGWTPRNTAQLVAFGRAVPIVGKTPDELAKLLLPLDLIVWNGHLVIVADMETTIESRLLCGKKGNGGVTATPLLKRLKEIMRTRRSMDVWPGEGKQQDAFVVRRWFRY